MKEKTIKQFKEDKGKLEKQIYDNIQAFLKSYPELYDIDVEVTRCTALSSAHPTLMNVRIITDFK